MAKSEYYEFGLDCIGVWEDGLEEPPTPDELCLDALNWVENGKEVGVTFPIEGLNMDENGKWDVCEFWFCGWNIGNWLL